MEEMNRAHGVTVGTKFIVLSVHSASPLFRELGQDTPDHLLSEVRPLITVAGSETIHEVANYHA